MSHKMLSEIKMKHQFSKLFVFCLVALFVAVFSAGCIDDVTTYTEVVEEPGIVMYISFDILASEMTLEVYVEDDYIPETLWEEFCGLILSGMPDQIKEEGFEFTEGYIYTTIEGIGHTASYSSTEGITYTRGSTKQCPIAIPPSED